MKSLQLPVPKIIPVLDPQFRPAVLANRNFLQRVRASGKSVSVIVALEQADGSVFHFPTEIFSENDLQAAENFIYVERIIKFLLWGWGGFRIHFIPLLFPSEDA